MYETIVQIFCPFRKPFTYFHSICKVKAFTLLLWAIFSTEQSQATSFDQRRRPFKISLEPISFGLLPSWFFLIFSTFVTANDLCLPSKLRFSNIKLVTLGFINSKVSFIKAYNLWRGCGFDFRSLLFAQSLYTASERRWLSFSKDVYLLSQNHESKDVDCLSFEK